MPTSSRPHLISKNPYTDDVLFEKEITENLEALFTKAENAQKHWSSLSVEQRYDYLETYKQLLEKNKESFAKAITQEMGKPLWEATQEVEAMCAKVPLSLKAYHERTPTLSFETPLGTAFREHRPHGVVAVFGPFNFPGHLPNGHIIPALLAGNVVLFKPSPKTPRVGEMLVDLLHQAGLPEGVIQLVLADDTLAKTLACHPRLNALFFTGSVPVGKALAKQWGCHIEKLLALELGGNNPMVVASINDLEAALPLIAQSAFLTSGQRCTSLRRLILIKKENLVDPLVHYVQKLQVGNPLLNPFMGPVIDAESAQGVLEQVKAIQGNMLLQGNIDPNCQALLTPSIIDTTGQNTDDLEVFGPLLQLLHATTLEEALQLANATSFGLSASILTDDEEEASYFTKHAKAGLINQNCPTNGALSSQPFGGIGCSGNFRPSGFYAADYVAYPVARVVQPKLTKKSTLPGMPDSTSNLEPL